VKAGAQARMTAFCVALLALVAALAHLPQFVKGPVAPDFAQDVYGPIVRAEAHWAAGDRPAALALWQQALVRAARTGRLDVQERIRRRVGAAGRELALRDTEAGWPALARYALWSEDFGRDAAAVESWSLTNGHQQSVFRYPLVLNSRRTVWGSRPKYVPLWLLRRYPDLLIKRHALRGAGAWLWGTSAADLPSAGRKAWAYPLYISRPGDFPKAGIALRCTGPGGAIRGFIGLEQEIRWRTPLEARPGLEARLPITVQPLHTIERFLVVGDDPPQDFVLELVREYASLESLQ